MKRNNGCYSELRNSVKSFEERGKNQGEAKVTSDFMHRFIFHLGQTDARCACFREGQEVLTIKVRL